MMATADPHRQTETAQEAVAEAYAIPEELWDALGFLCPEKAAQRHEQDRQASLAFLVEQRDEIVERRG
jgi:hypothetical protein